jgi:hypothetical protein
MKGLFDEDCWRDGVWSAEMSARMSELLWFCEKKFFEGDTLLELESLLVYLGSLRGTGLILFSNYQKK